ncbi:uncharacterized protein LOC111470759 [Cucurbita maxima]|uniref:Uncharacterized protein LOC111470759 n=1 Tax=Cucurbita maxima TaxID=3661 RepID=A0A6J1I3Y3_CUCMA|nr:uncharacterized protein LOC111470759 [Cucurbita maxima]
MPSCPRFHLPHHNNINLILPDGHVRIYHRPIHVSDVLLEFPFHLICRADSFYIGHKIPPLAPHHHLQLGHNYFLLPNHFFHSVLSFLTVASFFSSSTNNRIHTPFEIQRTPSGCLRIHLSDDFISGLLQQGNPKLQEPLGRICTTPQLAKDYTRLVYRRQWKPKLETIREGEKKGGSPFRFNKGNPFPSLLKPPRNPSAALAWTISANPFQLAYKTKIRIKSRA